MTTSTLFDRVTLPGLDLPNRVAMAPMTRVRADSGGLATASMAAYYAQRATAGLIVTEGVHPSAVGQSNPGTPGLHTAEQAASWRQVTDRVHAAGGRIFAQLMHAGRISHQETTGHQPVAPSAVRYDAEVFTPSGPQPASEPRELPTAEVPEHAAAFAEAARQAIDAGFDGVELHGANGYLINQFLSSNVNLRTDGYGGSIAGRIRFAVEAAAATVDAVGASRVGVRLSPGAGIQGIEETDVLDLYSALLTELAALDLAYVHLEAGAGDEVLDGLRQAWPGVLIMNPSSPKHAQRTDLAAANEWLGRGADVISFGRAFIANPDLVERLRDGVPLAVDDPATYYVGGEDGYTDYPTHEHTA